MDNIIWKKIPGFALIYEAGSNGQIRRLSSSYSTSFRGKPVTRPQPEKILCGTKLSKKGYARVRLDGVVYQAHRLLAITFIPNPLGLPQVNHKNGIKTDNRPENLEWVTNQQNRDHAVATGLQPRGSRVSKRLTEEDVFKIRALCTSGVPQSKIGEAFGICQQTVCAINLRKTWAHI
jgi:hypothetical protein